MPSMGRIRVLVSALVAVLSVSSLLAFAMRAPGYSARNVDLNDSGIWVTSNKDALFGRLIKSASSLDAWVGPPGGAQTSASLDVFQDQVFVFTPRGEPFVLAPRACEEHQRLRHAWRAPSSAAASRASATVSGSRVAE